MNERGGGWKEGLQTKKKVDENLYTFVFLRKRQKRLEMMKQELNYSLRKLRGMMQKEFTTVYQ